MITEYDLLGLATKTIDLNGIATYNYFDERGRLTKATYPEIGDVLYHYDALGRKTKVTDALSQETEWFFDDTTLQLTKTEDALGKVLRYYYDGALRVTKTGAGATGDIMPTLNYYDATTGRMTKTRYTDAASNTADVEYFFNAASQMTKLTDWTSGDNDLFYAYSDIGQLTKITDYDSEDLTYAYDTVGRVTSMIDYHGATTTYEYDNGGRLTTLIAPGSKEWEFVYNALGQPTQTYTPFGAPVAKSFLSQLFQCARPGATDGDEKLNPDGRIETFGYDSRNRLTRRYLGTEITGGQDLEEFVYELDNMGNITKTTELGGGVWNYAYDTRYRLTAAHKGAGGMDCWREEYVYDAGDNLLTKRTPDIEQFSDLSDDGWNGASTYVATKGYLERVSGTLDAGNCKPQDEDDFQICFSYLQGTTGEGQIRLRETGGGWMGVRVTATTLELWQSGGSTSLDSDTITTDTDVWYEYHAICDGATVEVWRKKKGTTDPMVKVLETTTTTQTTSGYLTFASVPGNFLGDIALVALDGDVLKDEVFTYNAANELVSQTANGATTNYAYDQFGRMTQKTKGASTATYYYHYGDKLTKVASNFGGEGTVTYTYGGDQKRRSRAVSGGDTTKYRYDQGWNIINEEDGSGTLQATYVHHPGRQIGTVLATSAGSTASSGTWNYYFQDAIGSTRGLWDEDGERIGKYDYTPFGGKLGESGVEISRKFTGHDWDADARLYYTAYRYYSPDSNRWLTRDPLGMVDGPNVYAYVVNNPVSMWDALGQCSANSELSALWERVSGAAGEFLSSFREAANGFATRLESGAYNAEIVLAITCLLALALEARVLARMWGDNRSSVGASLGILVATSIALAISLSYVMDGRNSNGAEEFQGMMPGFTYGVVFAWIGMIEIATTITVLTGGILGLGCVGATVLTLQKYGY